MITIIAEKPSVALDIARIVGAGTRRDGYMEGNGYAVTWAFGHLVEIYPDKGEEWDSPLPVLPERFLLRVGQTRGKDGAMRPDSVYRHQLDVIGSLFSRSEYIINAGDAGREGELIQRYIYTFVGARAPVRRLWISSMTDEAIKEGLRNLQPSARYDDLYLAGKARSEADWLIGINATRALTKAVGGKGVRSLGRVQTPTLALVCRRFIENRDFVPVPFWTLEAEAMLGAEHFTVRSESRYDDYDGAYQALVVLQRCGMLTVDSVEKETVKQQPPLLHDLTSLQREANKRFSMSAQEVLNTAQSLYEKKLITYPRTGSRYITEDVFRTLPALLDRLSGGECGPTARELSASQLSRRSVSDAKVTDHHALLPTGNAPKQITTAERNVYALILTRLLEAVSPVCEVLSTRVRLSAAGVCFTSRSETVLSPGWRRVRGEEHTIREGDDDGVVADSLPPFHEGDVCPLVSSDLREGKTKPKPLFTEASLLEAMEHAGKEVSEETLRDAIRDCGLGTPATRAGEIETLLRRGYMERQSRNLVPTALGLAIFDAVRGKAIADVEMTASWERTLAAIAAGQEDAAAFDRGIREYAGRIVDELLSNDGLGDRALAAQSLPGVTCPQCGRMVMLTSKVARCVDENCGWKVWRTLSGKTLSEREMAALIRDGMTSELRGIRSRDGKPFCARVKLEEDARLSFVFVDHSKDENGGQLLCPRCGSPVRIYPESAACQDKDCGWKLWRKVAGKSIPEAAVKDLLTGGQTAVMKGFRSKAGKTFDAALALNDAGEVDFRFQERKKYPKKQWKG